ARAEAYKQFNDAAVLALVLEGLPNVANELASPYSNIEHLSVFSTAGEAKNGQNISVGMAQVMDRVQYTPEVDSQDPQQRAADGGREVRAAADAGSPQRGTVPAAVDKDEDTDDTGEDAAASIWAAGWSRHIRRPGLSARRAGAAACVRCGR